MGFGGGLWVGVFGCGGECGFHVAVRDFGEPFDWGFVAGVGGVGAVGRVVG